jgi:hypothetical protein
MPELITPTEYARRRGVHHTAVLKALKAGRISLIDGKIDPVAADAQWRANTRNPKASFAQPAPFVEIAPRPSSDYQLADSATSLTIYDLQLSRAKREHHEANIAEMRERQKAGDLVELAQVRLTYTTLAAQFRAALERIPDKLAPRLAAELDPNTVHVLIQAELDQALLDMDRMAELIPAKLQEAAARE